MSHNIIFAQVEKSNQLIAVFCYYGCALNLITKQHRYAGYPAMGWDCPSHRTGREQRETAACSISSERMSAVKPLS